MGLTVKLFENVFILHTHADHDTTNLFSGLNSVKRDVTIKKYAYMLKNTRIIVNVGSNEHVEIYSHLDTYIRYQRI